MVDEIREPSLGVEEASTARWVNEALNTPASDATHGFNAVVKPRVTVERVDDHVLSLSFGWLPEFDVDAEELVHVTAPFWATQRNLSAVPGVSVTMDLNFSIGVSTPRAYAWGELVGAVNVTMPIGHETSEDAVRRTLPVLRETAQAMRSMI